MAVDPDENTVFVHRWTAAELERRCNDQNLNEEVRDAHQRAADYWQWRVGAWPQDRHADAHDYLEARHHLLVCGDIRQAEVLTAAVCSQLHTWGAWDHEATLIHDTLARLAPDSPRRPDWIFNLGKLAQDRGDYEQAEDRHQQALQVFERLGDQSRMASSYHELGRLAQDRGDYEQAEHGYQQALQMNEQLGNQSGMARGYGQLGVLAYLQRNYAQAEDHTQQALQIFERLGSQSAIAISYHQMGTLAQVRGDYEQAERRYQQALQIFERLGDRSRMVASWSRLGNLAMERQQFAEATVWHIRALLVGLRLQVRGAAYDAYALVALRTRMGSDTFVAVASTIVDETQLAELQAVLDSLPTNDSGAPEAG